MAGELLGGRQVAAGMSHPTEVVPHRGDLGMLRAEGGLEHGEDLPVERFGLGEPARVLVRDGKVVAQHGDDDVTVPEGVAASSMAAARIASASP